MFLLEELLAGATGAMTGFAFPEILVNIVSLYRAGRVDEAAVLHPGEVGRALLRRNLSLEAADVLVLFFDLADDLVAVASSPARALAHLRRDARRDAVEVCPSCLQERDLALELGFASHSQFATRFRALWAPDVLYVRFDADDTSPWFTRAQRLMPMSARVRNIASST